MINDNILSVNDLYKSFKLNSVLNGVNLKVKNGSSLVILGSSGSGKSVLLKCMIGLIAPDSGLVKLYEHNIHSISELKREEILKNCSFVFQNNALFDFLTVFDNIVFFMTKGFNLSSINIHDTVFNTLELVGLNKNILNMYPYELSGGMQKRVALARAIFSKPKLLFLDEPTSGLDPIMSNLINNSIVEIRKKIQTTTIIITHDINSAYLIATDIALLHNGTIVWYGRKEDMFTDKNEYLQQFINGNIFGPIKV